MAFRFFKRNKESQNFKESKQEEIIEMAENEVPEEPELSEVELMKNIPDGELFADYCISLTNEMADFENKRELLSAIIKRLGAKNNGLYHIQRNGIALMEDIIINAKSETIARYALSTLLIDCGYIHVSSLGNSIKEESVKKCLSSFKNLYQSTKHQFVKDSIVNLICTHDAEMAQYAVENHLLNHFPRFDKGEYLLNKCLKIIDNQELLQTVIQSDASVETKRIACANITDRGRLMEIAQNGDELILKYDVAMKLKDLEILLPLLDSELDETFKYGLLEAVKKYPEALDSRFVVEILKNTTNYEEYEKYLPFVTRDSLEIIRNHRKVVGLKLMKPIYEDYQEGCTRDDRIWSYRIVGYEEMEA